MTILINQSYEMQRVTGQQRYATEISQRLRRENDFGELAPQGFWARSTMRVWLWVQLVLPRLAGRALVLSMTSRAPLWRRRHVLVVHDLFVLTNPEWFSRRYVLTHAPLLRAQIRSAAAIVAVSEPVAEQLAPLYGGTIVVAPNAPSEIFAASEGQTLTGTDEILAGRGLRRGEYLLTVGSMDPRKNLGVLARAYAELTDEQRAEHPLVVVGGGSAVFRSEDIAWPTGTCDAGYVTDEELRALYRGCRAVVFPSLAEGFGLPLVEAAAAGAPSLVISDIPVFRWICGDGATYVDPHSVTSVAAGLRASIEAPVRQQIDLDRFSWDASARIVGAVCTSIGATLVNEQTRTDRTSPSTAAEPALTAAVVLASAGRPELLAAVMADIDAQVGVEISRVLSVPDETSLPGSIGPDWQVVTGTRGLAAQRNAGLAAVPDVDVVFFFDDDAVVRSDYVANGLEFFRRHPGIVGITGEVLLDGASSGEVSLEAARAALSGSDGATPSGRWRPTRELYGCNFAYRASAARDVAFDPRLPLYSWLEDHDFARRLMKLGRLGHVDDCVIVHRGAASGGRQAHARLGYSQVMNPVYLMRKGSFPAWLAAWEIFRPVAKTVLQSINGPNTGWRRQRLRGNLLAAGDIIRGRITPERIVEL